MILSWWPCHKIVSVTFRFTFTDEDKKVKKQFVENLTNETLNEIKHRVTYISLPSFCFRTLSFPLCTEVSCWRSGTSHPSSWRRFLLQERTWPSCPRMESSSWNWILCSRIVPSYRMQPQMLQPQVAAGLAGRTKMKCLFRNLQKCEGIYHSWGTISNSRG